MLDFIILFILKIKPANIYEIKKFIETNLQPFLQVSTGAIVPALKRLEKLNAITVEKSMTDGGLRKSCYKITQDGEKVFNEYLAEPSNAAPQIEKRELEIWLALIENVIFTDEQRTMLRDKIIYSLEKFIDLLEKELKNNFYDNCLSAEFLNLELIYADARLRYVKSLFQTEN